MSARLLRAIGPGLLLAATGVGAGDLATGSFTGARLGVAVLWAVAVGAFFKYVLTEGLARWQLATGETLLEGAVTRLGVPFQILFLVYLVSWSLFVGSALMSACGVTAHAILPLFDDPGRDKVVYGIAHSLAGIVLVRLGGYGLFEKIMRVCIGLMFVTVVVTAIRLQPDWAAVLTGLTRPRIPDFDGAGLSWTIALMGGVGGTLTVICYGYWIREEGRSDPDDLGSCRVDLAAGYLMTAIFGVAMVIIGSRIEVSGSGSNLIVALADELAGPLGEPARWLFLIGAWGAVFSSLLGVWQAVPYVFADFVGLSLARGRSRAPVSTQSRSYQGFLLLLGTVPALALLVPFVRIQKLYAIVGAGFMPFLALLLIFLNGRSQWVGARHRNAPATTATLIAIAAFFGYAGWTQLQRQL